MEFAHSTSRFLNLRGPGTFDVSLSGLITNQANDPRLLQVGLRETF